MPGGAPLVALCASRQPGRRAASPGRSASTCCRRSRRRLVELTRGPGTQPFAAEAAEDFFARLGFHAEWVEDAPGLVLGRIVCQLVNEAWFAVGEGVGSEEDVDTGLVLGLGHPRGPIAWGEAIGLEHVMAVLDGLWSERREERYRPAPLLTRAGGRPQLSRAAAS